MKTPANQQQGPALPHYHRKRLGHPRYPVLAKAALLAYQTAVGGRPGTVLDIGCSIGELLRQIGSLQPDCRLVGLDIDIKPGQEVYQGLHIQHSLGARHTRLPQAGADLVVSQEVYEHVPRRRIHRALAALDRMAAARAVLVFGAAGPAQPGKGHVYLRNKARWAGILVSRGGWRLHPGATAVYLAALAGQPRRTVDRHYLNNTQIFTRG